MPSMQTVYSILCTPPLAKPSWEYSFFSLQIFFFIVYGLGL